MSKSKILFVMTGSIACYKACGLISKLVQNNFEVQVIASPSALQFVGAATLEGLSGRPVVSELWAQGHAMDHIHLNRWADLILVAPATANYINKVAQGLGDDLLTTMFLALDFKKPFLLAPAMNTSMYTHPVTQKSILSLKNMGITVLESASGVLACGEAGYGKLLDPELIYNEIILALKSSFPPTDLVTAPRKISAKKIMITSGGTQEPIDAVRVLTNKSTGATGAHLAEHFIQLGFDVTYVHANSAKQPLFECKKLSFESFNNLQECLTTELGREKYDAILHAAAVSDFSVVNAQTEGKLSSAGDLVIQLKKNIKLVDQLRHFAKNPDLLLVAFKMTATSDTSLQKQAVEKVFLNSNADWVVHNDMSEMDWQSGKHIFHLYNKNKLSQTLSSKQDLAIHLGQLLSEELT